MNKMFYRFASGLAVFILMLGNFYAADASSTTYSAPLMDAALPAFPGAEGFGANTIGGRGGVVYEVTNTNDSGVGSLRSCVEETGPRICVFKVGGLISLNSSLVIKNPYITIAGQTAPGGGITLRNGISGGEFETLSVQTHDVIIRYITSRPGPGGMNHAIVIARNGIPIYNIIIDHSSFSWATDEVLTTWYRTYDITIQWNIISEGLNCSTHPKGCHSKGLLIGGYKGSESAGGKGTENVSVLNNLLAHNAERGPLLQVCGIVQVINNVTYNPQWTFSHQQFNCLVGEGYVNWVNNYHKKGPSSTSNSDLKVIPADDGTWVYGKIYVKGNIGPNRPNDNLPETNWVEMKSGAPAGILVTSPAPAPVVHSTSAIEAYNTVIGDGGAGNSRGLDCAGNWYVRRDLIDKRVVADVKNGTGKIIDDPSQVGGWVVPATGTPCLDTDHDGMPNDWENLYGFNLNIPEGSGDKDGDGYTNVEEYLNVTDPLISSLQTVTPTTTPLTTIFADVPDTYWAYSWINQVYLHGITGGCHVAPLTYCPEEQVTRAAMAIFLERGIKGGGYSPPDVTTQFGDTADHWAQDWIDALAADEITSGCGSGNYCPDDMVTRAQMAAFLLRARHGSDYVPPAANGKIFSDVPASYWAAAWIEQLAAEGITSGCGDSTYCPESFLTRAQMAVFLVRAFNLQ